MNNNISRIIFVTVALVFAASAQAQWNDPDETMEEITVYGDRDFSGFSSVFGLWDFTEMFSDNFMTQLDLAIEAAEAAEAAQCQEKIESWRQDCHTQMNVAAAGCGLSGVLVVGAAIRYVLPAFLRPTAGPIGGVGVGLSCSEWNTAAHGYCDAIADSDRGPTVAQCTTSGT